MQITEIVSIISGLASFTVIVGFVWRAIARFTRMEVKIDEMARHIRSQNRRLDRLEGKRVR